MFKRPRIRGSGSAGRLFRRVVAASGAIALTTAAQAAGLSLADAEAMAVSQDPSIEAVHSRRAAMEERSWEEAARTRSRAELAQRVRQVKARAKRRKTGQLDLVPPAARVEEEAADLIYPLLVLLAERGQLGVLDRAQARLWRAYRRRRDPELRNSLVESYQPFALDIVRRFAALSPHTIGKSRSCESCHRSSTALGLGQGALSIEDGEVVFEPARTFFEKSGTRLGALLAEHIAARLEERRGAGQEE